MRSFDINSPPPAASGGKGPTVPPSFTSTPAPPTLPATDDEGPVPPPPNSNSAPSSRSVPALRGASPVPVSVELPSLDAPVSNDEFNHQSPAPPTLPTTDDEGPVPLPPSSSSAPSSSSVPALRLASPVPASFELPSLEAPVGNDEFSLQTQNSFDDYSDNDSLMPRKRRLRDEVSTATTDALAAHPLVLGTFLSALSGMMKGRYSVSLGAMMMKGHYAVPQWAAKRTCLFSNIATTTHAMTLRDDASSYSSLDDELPHLHQRDHDSCYDDDTSPVGSSVTSFASQATLLAYSTPTITTPSQELMDLIRDTTIGKKAVRSDNTEVPVSLWDIRIKTDSTIDRTKVFTAFRNYWRRLFQRYLYLDFLATIWEEFGDNWFNNPTLKRSENGQHTKLGHLISGATNALFYANKTNFFEYLSGSKTFYFRFPVFHRKMTRDGAKLFFEKPGPKLTPRQLEHAQPAFSDSAAKKKSKRRTTRLDIASIIKYFAVPKGEADWRVVYDATASGLNECTWAPSFWLPTVDSLVRALDEDSWMADRDIGDMFLNFELHHKAWNYVGVDLAPVLDEAEKKDLQRWHHWVVRGDRHDPENAFHWDHIELNLPGPDYIPTKSWVMKVRLDSTLASDLFTFVTTKRLTGRSEEATWQAGHVLGSKQAYLGIQDAARKVGECSQQPRAWAGAVVHVVPHLGVCVLTSEEKWKKLKDIIQKWKERILEGKEELDHKELLSDRGFLVYVTRAYPGMVRYLKGFHLTIEMWRGNRDADGWKLPSKQLQSKVMVDNHLGPIDDEEAEMSYLMRSKVQPTLRAPPSGFTPVVPRLLDDLKALHLLTRSPLPPLRIVRPIKIVQVLYGFGDASGKGFGSTTGHGISGGNKDKRGIWIPTHEPPGNTHLWTPPPAAADAALEQLLQARHKRTDTSHIIAIPRLLAPRWQRLFHKAVDVSFSIPPGTSFWPTNMFEPLWVGIVLPYHRFSPWQLSQAPLMVDMGRKLHKVCSASEADAGHILRKLCKLPRRLATLQERVVRGVLMPRQECVSNGKADR
eukprot:CCRYP_002101-RA/>CCRYP_002101-RA protein AED:0.38 eAED:0.31 QI:0/0/0/0.8/0.5/0.4/5/0/1035